MLCALARLQCAEKRAIIPLLLIFAPLPLTQLRRE
jgi:hypothetical protein